MGENGNRIARGIGRTVWHIVLPFSAMARTARLARAEFDRSKENLRVIRELASDAKSRVDDARTDGDGRDRKDARQSRKKLRGARRNRELRRTSFEEAIRQRSPNALTIPELRKAFLRKKRIALVTGGVTLVYGLVSLGAALYFASPLNLAFAIAMIVGSAGLAFLYALGAELRLWQLRVRRLSAEEKGGLKDFISETPGWYLRVLDPELRSSSKGASES